MAVSDGIIGVVRAGVMTDRVIRAIFFLSYKLFLYY